MGLIYSSFIQGFYDKEEKEKELTYELIMKGIHKKNRDEKVECCMCFKEGFIEFRCLKCNHTDINLCLECSLRHAKYHKPNDMLNYKSLNSYNGNKTDLF